MPLTGCRVPSSSGLLLPCDPWKQSPDRLASRSYRGKRTFTASVNPGEVVAFIEGGFDLDESTWTERRAAVMDTAARIADTPPEVPGDAPCALETRDVPGMVSLRLALPRPLYDRIDAAAVNHNAMTGADSWTDLQGWIMRAIKDKTAQFEAWFELPAVNLEEREPAKDGKPNQARRDFREMYCNRAGFGPDHPLRSVPLSDWHRTSETTRAACEQSKAA